MALGETQFDLHERATPMKKLRSQKGKIAGMVLLPPETESAAGVLVAAFADADLNTHVGDAETDEKGRFAIDIHGTAPANVWFRWTRGKAAGRTPMLNPAPTFEPCIRLPCYSATRPSTHACVNASWTGRLGSRSGPPIANATVWLVEQTMRHAKRIAAAVTNGAGIYEIFYDQATLMAANGADLRVVAFATDGLPLIETAQRDILLPNRLLADSWIHDSALREAAALIGRASSSGELDPQDLDYLISRNNPSSRAAVLLRKAQVVAEATSIGIAEAAVLEAAPHGLAPKDAIRAGVRRGWISPHAEGDLPEVEGAIRAFRDPKRLVTDSVRRPLEEILEKRIGDNSTRRQTVEAWQACGQSQEVFHDYLNKHAQLASESAAICFTLAVVTPADRNIDLVRALEQRHDAKQVGAAQELAEWEESAWEKLLREETVRVPEQFKAAAQDSHRVYARHLRKAFQQAFPNTAVRAHLRRHASRYQWGNAVQAFADAHPQLDMGVPVERLRREHPDVFASDAGREARHGLAVVQRVHRLTRDLDASSEVVASGLSSARAIANTSSDVFIRRFSAAFGGDDSEAAAAHRRAVRVAALAKLTYSQLAPQHYTAPLAIFRGPDPTSEQHQSLTTWRDLFGTDDLGFCECAHCKSIFGPAAYLFDMLLFLDRFSAPPIPPQPDRPRRTSVLAFLNCVERAEQIVEWVKDDPAFLIHSDRTRGVPLDVATRILARRRSLGGRFSSLHEVDAIEGVGPDTLHDLIHTSWGAAGPLAVQRALAFLNATTSPQEIAGRIKDDPDYQRGSDGAVGVPLALAERILEHRALATGQQFASMSQVAEVPGVGSDTLHDMIYTFYEVAHEQIASANWFQIGSTPHGFTTLAATHLLLSVDGGGTIWTREISPLIGSTWMPTEFTFDMYRPTAMAVSGGKLYAVTDASAQGDLLFLGYPSEPDPVRIGDAPNVIALAAALGYLFAATSDNKLLKRPAGSSQEPWVHIGEAGGVIALAAGDFDLYGATADNTLLIRDAFAPDAQWQIFGDSHNVIALVERYGLLFGMTGEGEVWLRGLPERLVWGFDQRTLLDNFRSRRPDVTALTLSCDNTNIEVPHIDLVNELLGDLVCESLCFGAIQSSKSLTERSTTGTSKERRAWPEHDLPAMALAELKHAARPWGLPYDFERDRAESARKALPIDANAVTETAWLFYACSSIGAAAPQPELTASLGIGALGLSATAASLITTETLNPREVWGDEIADTVAEGKPLSIGALQRAGQWTLTAIEDALESPFVQQIAGTSCVTVGPPTTCDPEKLMLQASPNVLPRVLDRLHRFERLRRTIEWTASQLDCALVALQLSLRDDDLVALGLLRYLQKRLNLDPDAVLALFQDPLSEPVFTLRTDKRVTPAFQRLFGNEPATLPSLTGDDLTDSHARDAVAASIGQRVGAGPDEVRFVLEGGYAGVGGTIFRTPNDILTASNPIAAWRIAVAAVFRVTKLASALRLSLSDFSALADLWATPFLLKAGISRPLLDQVVSTVGFAALVSEARAWPLPASEVLYVTSDHRAAANEYGLGSFESGRLLLQLKTEAKRTVEGLDGAASPAQESITEVLAELLGQAGPNNGESPVARVLHWIEWTSVFPDLTAHLLDTFGQHVIIEDEVPQASPADTAEASQAWSGALALLPELFARHLALVTGISGADTTTSEYHAALAAFESETEAAVQHPSVSTVECFSHALEPLLLLMGVPSTDIAGTSRELANSALAAALQIVAGRLSVHRRRASDRWLVVLSAAAKRQRLDGVVVDGLARAFSLDVQQAGDLLTRLLRDPDDDQPLLRAFVSRDASTPRLDGALVRAVYSNVGATAGGGTPQVDAARLEPNLQLDWGLLPPPAGIDPKRFRVTLHAKVPASSLLGNAGVRRLVAQSTGRVTATLRAGAQEVQVLDFDAQGIMSEQAWDSIAAETLLGAIGSAAEVELRVAFVAAVAPGGPTSELGPQLHVLIESPNGILVPLAAGTLGRPLARLDKAARVLRALSMPSRIWTTLATLPPGHQVNLNDLPIDGGAAFDLWQKASALWRIWGRRADDAALDTLIGVGSGSTVSLNALGRWMGLAVTEVRAVLALLGIDVQSEDTEATLPVGWRIIDAALQMSDIARAARLPLQAISSWGTAPPEQVYRWALGALRALGSEAEWLDVLQHVHDPVREHLRDALVAWLVTHSRMGSDGLPRAPFSTAEEMSRYLLTDVQMSACMMSSRVQFGYAAVQRYVDAIRLGFESGPVDASEQERFEREWSWRRFYRLWEANRRVFAYPENWLEPDLRPDKSPFFQELEDELLEGPLTTPAAERALASYLGKVVDAARPEIVAVVAEDAMPDAASPLGFRDPELLGTHVFARSRNEPRQLFYRRQLPDPDGRWTAWERIDADLPGTHFIPLIAFRRLYLIVAEFGFGRAQPENCDCDGSSPTNQMDDPRKNANVELSWIERRHGTWSSRRRSGLIEFDASSVEFDDFGSGDYWSDFPGDRFPPKTLPSDPLATLEVSLTVSNWDPNGKHPSDSLRVFLRLSTREIELGLLHGIGESWFGGDDIKKEFPLTNVDRTDVRGVRLEFTPTGRDDLLVYNMQFRFYSQSNAYVAFFYDAGGQTVHHYYEFIDRNDPQSNYFDPPDTNNPNAPLVRASYQFRLDFTLPAEQITTIRWQDWTQQQMRERFEVEDVKWDPPPPEAYALHAETATIPSGEAAVLRLTTQDGVPVCRRNRRRFRFTAFDSFPDLEGHWPTDWIPGPDRCIKQATRKRALRLIDLFADGTVATRAPAPSPFSSWLQRGEYEGTVAQRQHFLAPDENVNSFFISGNNRAISVPRGYRLTLPAQRISTSTSPALVEELPANNNSGAALKNEDARTLFVTQESGGARFISFWHPCAGGLLRLLLAYGVPRLLSRDTQTLEDPELAAEAQAVDFFPSYAPNSSVSLGPPPDGDIDFSVKGAYADYNWELFLHAPLLIAQRLSEAGKFEDADRWFRLLFDPSRGRLAASPEDSFQTRPLRNATALRLDDILHALDDQTVRAEFAEQVDRLNRFPYQPHLIARTRTQAYQKSLVMKYLDHLIAWGDELFRRAYATDNRTELENAGSRYDLAACILGRRPEGFPAQARPQVFAYDTLRANRDALDLWDPLVTMEDFLANQEAGLSGPELANDGQGIPDYLYFCVPHNEELLKYWDTLADRLAKMRSCRDIEGVRRTLSLYGRRIDPGLLVRATAMGLDVDLVLGQVSAPTPRFRFATLLQRARGACDRAQSFGQALLGAIEKRESEELGKLRSQHELSLLRASKRVRDEQVDEARLSLDALWKSRESAEVRRNFYASRKRLNFQEIAEGDALEKAMQNEQLAAAASSAAADRALLPNNPNSVSGGYRYPPSTGFFETSAGVSYDFGGHLFANIEQQRASAATYLAGRYRAEAGRLARQAQYDRRAEDWQLQLELAEKDLEQIDKQISSAEIRLRIAEIEQENQVQQIDQVATVDAYLRDKFTNAKLYRWMESRLSRLYYQQYRLAYDLALKAHRAMRYELGLEDDSLLPDTWNAAWRGMEAAADLQHELEKLETRYLDAWRREHEKVKIFSLADRRPLELLELRQTGRCVIQILEHDLDEDEPGDYFRRIKQVAVDIPCVRGPDVSVNARLTLLRSETRIKPHSSGAYARPEGIDGANHTDFRDDMGGVEHVVTSTGVSDTGQFDSGGGGDRLAPFEGSGVISTWQIDLPIETNHFDRAAISDVKLRILYTARDGGDTARIAALQARWQRLTSRGRTVMLPLTSYFSNAWCRFTSGAGTSRELTLDVQVEALPHELRQGSALAGAALYLEMRDSETLKLADPNAGALDEPLDLPGIVRFTPKSLPALGGMLTLTLDGNSDVPKAGWLEMSVKRT